MKLCKAFLWINCKFYLMVYKILGKNAKLSPRFLSFSLAGSKEGPGGDKKTGTAIAVPVSTLPHQRGQVLKMRTQEKSTVNPAHKTI